MAQPQQTKRVLAVKQVRHGGEEYGINSVLDMHVKEAAEAIGSGKVVPAPEGAKLSHVRDLAAPTLSGRLARRHEQNLADLDDLVEDAIARMLPGAIERAVEVALAKVSEADNAKAADAKAAKK